MINEKSYAAKVFFLAALPLGNRPKLTLAFYVPDLYYHTPKVTATCTTARSETRNPMQSMVHSYAANVFFLAALPHVVVTTGKSPKVDSG